MPTRGKVLVVDDDAAVLQVMGHMLLAGGFQPAMADSGEQALTLLARTEFDAALVDKNLVGMDGIDLLRHVRKRQPRCACIVMTAYPSTGSAIEALRLGAQDYLEKPSPELDVIADRVELAIRNARLAGERETLHARLTQLQAENVELVRRALDADMQAASVEVRLADLYRQRDAQLAREARELLAQARMLPDSAQLVAAIERHLAALESA